MEGDISAGKGESPGVKRRAARATRRVLARRAQRLRNVLHALQAAGLLPPGKAEDVIPPFDAAWLGERLSAFPQRDPERHRQAHLLPYLLRKEALDRPLTRPELGRALYHLAQRRGFLTNRKAEPKKDEKPGEVKQGIDTLRGKMKQANARTLGEYFAGLDPQETRIRQRWTGRGMYLLEFERIWLAQAPHHAEVLTNDLKAELHRAIFHQRPLRSAAGLVGPCALEPSRRRAPACVLPAQRFRLLQQAINCRVVEATPAERLLTDEEFATLVNALEQQGDMGMKDAKKLLALSNKCKFTFEEGGEKKLAGNRTNAALAKVFGPAWEGFTRDQRDGIVCEVRSFEDPEALVRRATSGRAFWNLDARAAAALADVKLQPGYCSLSRRALEKLLPLMERRVPYATAAKKIYGEFDPHSQALDLLPRVSELKELRNPVVSRVLTETRKVVNAIIREHGIPGQIRVELARDLKQSKDQRVRTTKNARDNEKSREAARAQIDARLGLRSPGPDDILKVQLAEECNWECPYTGRHIDIAALVGDNPQFDIEHIIPFSRCLDDSFGNKTLCYHEANRHVKGNRTPLGAFGSSPEWERIVQRVEAFQGNAAKGKLRRFVMTEEEVTQLQDFANSQLNDTRYASKLAMRYLALLYGGLWDEGGTRRIQAGSGNVTKYVRQAHDLNRILGDGPGKSRDDHRHHAVDALAIALTDPGLVKALSDAAVRSFERRGKRRHFDPIPEPWPQFDQQARAAIAGIVVSHRASHKVSGALHAETNYAKVELRDPQTGKTHAEHRVRKPLSALKANQVDDIVDDAIRGIVKGELERRGVADPAKAFATPAQHPVIPPSAKRPGGRPVPIHSVRIRVKANPKPVGKPGRQRLVATESNHHLEVVAVLDAAGNEVKWEGHIVDMMEAHRRLANRLPIVQRDHGANKRFKFSLAPKDTVRFTTPGDGPALALIKSVSVQLRTQVPRVEFAPVNDARIAGDIKADTKKGKQQWFSPVVPSLRKLGCQKVTVSPLGEVRDAHD